MAHGAAPVDETASSCSEGTRTSTRHQRIPPKTLLTYFPRLDEIAHKTLFGTDWPGPGVPTSTESRGIQACPVERYAGTNTNQDCRFALAE